MLAQPEPRSTTATEYEGLRSAQAAERPKDESNDPNETSVQKAPRVRTLAAARARWQDLWGSPAPVTSDGLRLDWTGTNHVMKVARQLGLTMTWQCDVLDATDICIYCGIQGTPHRFVVFPTAGHSCKSCKRVRKGQQLSLHIHILAFFRFWNLQFPLTLDKYNATYQGVTLARTLLDAPDFPMKDWGVALAFTQNL
jgi:hypothetical protein